MSGWKIKYVEPKTVTITLGQFFDAIEENGLPQTTGMYWDEYKGEVRSGCALGQAALNLNTDNTNLNTALEHIKSKGGRFLTNLIITGNDEREWTLKQIADRYRKMFSGRLEEKINIEQNLVVIKDTHNG